MIRKLPEIGIEFNNDIRFTFTSKIDIELIRIAKLHLIEQTKDGDLICTINSNQIATIDHRDIAKINYMELVI